MKFVKGSKNNQEYFEQDGCEIWAYHDSIHISCGNKRGTIKDHMETDEQVRVRIKIALGWL